MAELDRLRGAEGWHVPAGLVLRDHLWRAVSTPPTTAFEAEEAAMLAAAEDSGAFLRHRRAALAALVARHTDRTAVWDVGAGTGGIAADLARSGRQVVAVEPSPEAARWAAGRAVTTLCCELADLGLPTGSIHSVTMLDVLEHLDDAAAVLAEVSRVLARDGVLFVSVPAGRYLWSQMDELAGHRWRATAWSLRSLVVPHGFDELELRHWGAVGVPAVLALRVLPYRLGRRLESEGALAATASELGRDGAVIDRVLRTGLGAEDRMRRWVATGVGTSIFAAFRRAAH